MNNLSAISQVLSSRVDYTYFFAEIPRYLKIPLIDFFETSHSRSISIENAELKFDWRHCHVIFILFALKKWSYNPRVTTDLQWRSSCLSISTRCSKMGDVATKILGHTTGQTVREYTDHHSSHWSYPSLFGL